MLSIQLLNSRMSHRKNRRAKGHERSKRMQRGRVICSRPIMFQAPQSILNLLNLLAPLKNERQATRRHANADRKQTPSNPLKKRLAPHLYRPIYIVFTGLLF